MWLRELLGWDESLYLALRRRAKRNYRSPRQELVAIVAEALREEAEAIRAELAAELPDEPREEVMARE